MRHHTIHNLFGAYSRRLSLSAPFGRAAQQTAHHRLLWWEVGPSCEHHYQYRGQWLHLRPDALFTYTTDTASHLAWVEYDRATEAREALVTKFQTYQTFLMSQQWRKAGLSRLPTLLIVVSSPTQRQMMRDVVREVMGVGAMRVRLTTMPQLQNKGPQAAIWEQLVPVWEVIEEWRFLRNEGRVRWYHEHEESGVII